MRRIRWGIAGTGGVAAAFARDLALVPEAELLAVGSRTQERATSFADNLRIPRAHGSYQALAGDPNIDVVYVATPNTCHRENCALFLEGGKAVLCEKPFAASASEAQEIVRLAREKRLFCMEAMWMRFLPLIRELPQTLESIGDLRMVTIQLGFPRVSDPRDRVFNPRLGGGAILDLGIYPLSLAYQLLGMPTRVDSQVIVGTTGVDEQVGAILGFPAGRQAVIVVSVRNQTPNDAVIMGTQAYVRVHGPVYSPHKLSLIRTPTVISSSKAPSILRAGYRRLSQYVTLPRPGRVKTIRRRFKGSGYSYEAAEVVRCLQAGETESTIMPLEDSIRILEIVDAIRAGRRLHEQAG